MSQGRAQQPNWPRYSTRAFPSYRYLPGRNPHPRRNPQGHSYGISEPDPSPLDPGDWAASDWYRYGVDLFNFGYYWECHEVFEGFWNAAGHQTEQGQFFQGLIQVAAANVKRALGQEASARKLARSALERLTKLPGTYMGLDVDRFAKEVYQSLEDHNNRPPLLRLTATSQPPGDPQ